MSTKPAPAASRIPQSIPHPSQHPTSLRASLIPCSIPHPLWHPASLAASHIPQSIPHPSQHPASLAASRIPHSIPHPSQHPSHSRTTSSSPSSARGGLADRPRSPLPFGSADISHHLPWLQREKPPPLFPNSATMPDVYLLKRVPIWGTKTEAQGRGCGVAVGALGRAAVLRHRPAAF